MSLPLPKEAMLTKPWQYQQVYRHGKRVRGKDVTLIYWDNGQGCDRLGLSVGGQRLAVRRNRIKRLLREFYRQHRGLPSLVAKHPAAIPGVDLVVATNQAFQPRGLADIHAVFSRFLGTAPSPATPVAGLDGHR